MTDKFDRNSISGSAPRRATLPLRLLASAAIAAPIGFVATAAFAQATTNNDAANVQEVVVTGSRVARTGFTTPTPTTVVGQQLLQQNAAASVANSLQQLPAFRADLSAATSGPRAENTPGSAYANLRGLGATRTLVLVNSERVVPNNPLGQVDLNTIPAALIERIDVVTGGASAAYGSDAVAGVVNVILKKNVQGIEGDISYGQSSRGDNVERRVSLIGGSSFADGNGHFVLGGEYSRNMGVGLPITRGWGREGWGNLPNPAVTPSNPASPTNPANLRVPLYQPSNMYVGGLITSGPLRGTTFEQGGVLGTFDYGNIVGPSFMSGGSNYYVQYYNTNLQPPAERALLNGRVDYNINPDQKVYAEASWASSHSVNRGGTPRNQGNGVAGTPTGVITARIDNPYMPTALRNLMVANGITSAPVGRYNFDLGASINDAKLKTHRFALGGSGKLFGDWTWDAYAAYGRTKFVEITRNTEIVSNFIKSVDAATNASGQIVCRVNADAITTNDDPACVPANIFGVGTISAAAKAYINGDEYYQSVFTQKVISGNIHGTPFNTWAGPVSVAAGLEHRKEKVNGEADALSLASRFYVGNQKPVAGSLKVTEGYAEAVIPLLADMSFAKKVEFDGAVRRTDYSTSGAVTTWKAGLNWEVNDQIRFRATRSRDIRAPNLNELFSPGGNTITGVVNNVLHTSPLVPQVVGGNPNLKAEIANTTTAGVVFRPTFIDGFELSIDYFKIDLKDAVGSLTAQQIADGCQLRNIADLCSLITFTPGGEFTNIFRPSINIATVNTRGWDFEARYRVPISNWDMPGSLTLNAYVTNLAKQVVDDGTGILKDYAGEVGNQGLFGGPKWRGTVLATYTNGPWSITGTYRYVGGGKYRTDWGPSDIDNNHVKSAQYFNLSSELTVMQRDDGSKVVVYGLIQNLFDKDPPVAPTIAWPTNPQYFDMIGRTWKAGVRFNF